MHVHPRARTQIEIRSPKLDFSFILTLVKKFFFLLLSKVEVKCLGHRVSLCFIFVCSSHKEILAKLRSPSLVIKFILTSLGLQLLLVSIVKIQRSRLQSNFACSIAVITNLVIILSLSRISFSYFKSQSQFSRSNLVYLDMIFFSFF